MFFRGLLRSLLLFPFLVFSSEKVDTLIASSPFHTAHWGILILDLKTGEVLYDKNGEKLFNPSSVTKIFTAKQALETYGDDFQIKTSIDATEQVNEEGLLRGNLWLTGRGDPTLDDTGLATLAAKLKEQGVRTVRGKVLADESFFPKRLPTHADWEDITWYFAPVITPLTFEANAALVTISPGKQVNSPPIVEVKERVPYCEMINQATTAEPGKMNSIDIYKEPGTKKYIVTGQIPLKGEKTFERIAIHDPATYAREVFLSHLEREGITVQNHELQGEKRVELASISSPPLSKLLHLLNKKSDNLAAELLYSLTTKRSSKKIVPSLYDASGLSRHNLVSPNVTCQTLREIYLSKYQKSFLQSLGIAGVDGRMTERRFKNTIGQGKIFAKTGTMSSNLGLAGYALTPRNQEVVFCIYCNNFTKKCRECEKTLDQVLLTLLESI